MLQRELGNDLDVINLAKIWSVKPRIVQSDLRLNRDIERCVKEQAA